MTETSMTSVGPDVPRQLGDYKLVRLLGQGGMGQVYYSISPDNTVVAIKVMRPHLAEDPEFRRRFAWEVAVAQRVDSPFTARVLDSGVNEDTPWLATEYIPGHTLAEIVAEFGPLSDQTVRRLAAGLARALQDIHSCRVVHRDLKPANVMYSETGPRIIDFGIARALDALSLTATGYIIGTREYMSPEHHRGGEVTEQSDVYSLGAVLTFAATGQPPPAGDRQALNLRDVSPMLRSLIKRCLRPDPARRCTVSDIIAECGQVHDEDLYDWLPPQIDEFVRTQAQQSDRHLSAVGRDEAPESPLPPKIQMSVDSYSYLIDSLARSAEKWPLVRQHSLRHWSIIYLILSIVTLVEVASRTPEVTAYRPHYLPWLATAESVHAAIVEFTAWLPDPITSWAWAASSVTNMDRRLAGIACVQLLLSSIARRIRRDSSYKIGLKAVASYSASLITLAMIVRLFHTGFNPFIHIAEYLRLWTLLAFTISATIVLVIGGRAR